MDFTQAGLPNSCSECGLPVPPTSYWLSETTDSARAGMGVCIHCYKEEMPDKLPLENYKGIGHKYAIGLARAGVLSKDDLASADIDKILPIWHETVSAHPAQRYRLKNLIKKAKNDDLHLLYLPPRR